MNLPLLPGKAGERKTLAMLTALPRDACSLQSNDKRQRERREPAAAAHADHYFKFNYWKIIQARKGKGEEEEEEKNKKMWPETKIRLYKHGVGREATVT